MFYERRSDGSQQALADLRHTLRMEEYQLGLALARHSCLAGSRSKGFNCDEWEPEAVENQPVKHSVAVDSYRYWFPVTPSCDRVGAATVEVRFWSFTALLLPEAFSSAGSAPS